MIDALNRHFKVRVEKNLSVFLQFYKLHLLRTSVSTLIGKHKIHLEEHGAIKNKFQMGYKVSYPSDSSYRKAK